MYEVAVFFFTLYLKMMFLVNFLKQSPEISKLKMFYSDLMEHGNCVILVAPQPITSVLIGLRRWVLKKTISGSIQHLPIELLRLNDQLICSWCLVFFYDVEMLTCSCLAELQMWDLFRKETISEKVDIWVSLLMITLFLLIGLIDQLSVFG